MILQEKKEKERRAREEIGSEREKRESKKK